MVSFEFIIKIITVLCAIVTTISVVATTYIAAKFAKDFPAKNKALEIQLTAVLEMINDFYQTKFILTIGNQSLFFTMVELIEYEDLFSDFYRNKNPLLITQRYIDKSPFKAIYHNTALPRSIRERAKENIIHNCSRLPVHILKIPENEVPLITMGQEDIHPVWSRELKDMNAEDFLLRFKKIHFEIEKWLKEQKVDNFL